MLPYIELKNIVYKYPKNSFSLNTFSLSLMQNEFTVIKGANGSGKSTIGKIIAGILKPQRGTVVIDKKDTRTMSLGEIGCKLGYVFQNPDCQIFCPTVRKEISFALELKGISKEEFNERTDYILEIFNLFHLSNEFPFKLSRGEKQRLAIASILVKPPAYLFLDEPTTGLDIKNKKILSSILHKYKNNGMGIAVISHDELFIEQHADRVIMVDGGEIIEDYYRGD